MATRWRGGRAAHATRPLAGAPSAHLQGIDLMVVALLEGEASSPLGERVAAAKAARAFAGLRMPESVTRALVACTEAKDDPCRGVSTEVLRVAFARAPRRLAGHGAVEALVAAALDPANAVRSPATTASGACPLRSRARCHDAARCAQKQAEAVLLTFAHVLDSPLHRPWMPRLLISLLVTPLTECAGADAASGDEQRARQQGARRAIVTLCRTWPVRALASSRAATAAPGPLPVH